MKKVLIYLLVFVVLGVALVFESGTAKELSLLETIESPLEIINMIIALFAMIFALGVVRLFGTGSQSGAWKWMSVAAILFAVVEILGILKGLDVWKVGGLLDFAEFGFVVALLWGFWTQERLLKKLMKK